MISFLAKLFIRDEKNYTDPTVRQKYGILCSLAGIALNLLLFGGKCFIGLLTGSIAVTADAFNNLSDAGSAVITLVGFRLSGQKPDPRHPFGHGRFEYISGLFVSFLILLMGFELASSSFDKILHPQSVEFRWITVVILSASILVKLYMGLYNRAVGKKIKSAAMMATMTDSMSDAAATAVILACTLLSRYTDLNPDGYCGLAVALMIFVAGIRSAKETISPLLGQPPEKEFVEQIEKTVLSYEGIVGIHDLIVHDYGPGRKVISLHAEVPGDADLWETHDLIDNVEQQLASELNSIVVIHMDPIAVSDVATLQLRNAIAEELKEIHPQITIHDFRAVPGPTHTNVIFDAVLPFDSKLSEEEAKEKIVALIAERHKNTNGVVLIDRGFI